MTATTIKLKRSTTANSIPATTSLASGELALNTNDGKLFFKKTVSGTDSIVTLQPFPTGGTTGQILSLDGSNNLTWITNSSSITVRNTMGNGGAVSKTITSVTGFNFDESTGINVDDQGNGNVFVSLGSSFKTIQVPGRTSLVAVGEDTLTIQPGSGISITTSNTAPKTLTITATGGGGGSSTAPIKTFNILGDFGQLTGTARFYPAATDTIRSVILSVSKNVQQDLTVGLYRNNEFLQFFTISAGQNYATYSSLEYGVQQNESYTVNVVGGYGSNLSMALYNINL